MESDICCMVSRDYSAIPGFQRKSRDIYSLKPQGAAFIIEFSSKADNAVLKEQMHVSGLPFSEIRSLIEYMSENAVRLDSWKDVLQDYCSQHGAVATQ